MEAELQAVNREIWFTHDHNFHDAVDDFDKLTIGTVDLGSCEVYGVKKMNKLKILGNYLYGITGNVVFDNKILIIDRKNNRFGIIN